MTKDLTKTMYGRKSSSFKGVVHDGGEGVAVGM